MLLTADDAALFYRAWGSLLVWVNTERQIVPPFPLPTPGNPIEPELANKVRKVLWAEDALRERFLVEGAADLSDAERELIASWRHRVDDTFVIFKHLKKHSIFLSHGAYAVLGIYTPLAAMFPEVPTFIRATLIPFRDVIITDGIIESVGPMVLFGPGARRAFKAEYDEARKGVGVRTTLPVR